MATESMQQLMKLILQAHEVQGIQIHHAEYIKRETQSITRFYSQTQGYIAKHLNNIEQAFPWVKEASFIPTSHSHPPVA
jgi:predicted KAP-like P-loop ATPase